MTILERGASNLTKMMIGHGAVVAVVMVSGILIPRALGAADYGRYAAVLALAAMLQALTGLGLPWIETRFLAPMWQRSETEAASRLGSTIWLVRTVLGVVAGLVAVPWLAGSAASDQNWPIIFGLAAWCALSVGEQANQSLFLPLGHVGELVCYRLAQSLLRLVIVLLTFSAFGLVGVFAALPFLHFGLWSASLVHLARIFPLRPLHADAASLRPFLPYARAAYVGMLCSVAQAQFLVFAVASWGSEEDAGFTAVSLLAFMLVRDSYFAARRALMPILSEMEEAAQPERLMRWIRIMLLYGVATLVAATVIWTATGRTLVGWFLGEEFLPVVPAVQALLAAAVIYCAAETLNGILYLRNRASRAAVNTVIFTVAVLTGLSVALHQRQMPTAVALAFAFVAASVLFLAITWRAVQRGDGPFPPIASTLGLGWPLLTCLPGLPWPEDFAPRTFVALVVLLVYGIAAIASGHLRFSELHSAWRSLRRRGGRPINPEQPIPPAGH